MISSTVETTKYHVSLMYNICSNWYTPKTHEWWTKMTESIYVGALPLKDNGVLSYYYDNKSHCEILKELGITDVISINKNFELKTPTLMSNPVSDDDWKNCGINQHIFETGDFEAIDIDIINKCIDLMEDILKDKKKVIYLHCKAGRGRSIIIYACYLIKKTPSVRVEDVLTYITGKRSIACLNKEQLQNIHDYYERIVLTK